MNRAFKVIQGHPYWYRQESRTVCCRNVQLMPTLFLKLTKRWQRETTPLKFEDVRARNTFEYLQMISIARNYSYWPTFLPLIVWSTFWAFHSSHCCTERIPFFRLWNRKKVFEINFRLLVLPEKFSDWLKNTALPNSGGLHRTVFPTSPLRTISRVLLRRSSEKFWKFRNGEKLIFVVLYL